MYDIRLVPVGTLVCVPDSKNTMSIYPPNEPRFPIMSAWSWIINSLSIITSDTDGKPDWDMKKLATFAREGLETLPNLGRKFILTYRQDQYLFDNCFLATTRNTYWWQTYPVIGNLEDILLTGRLPVPEG